MLPIYVMTAHNLKQVQADFPVGLWQEVEMEKLLAVVDRYAKEFDPGIPEVGTAFLRLKVIVRKGDHDVPYLMSGGALSRPTMTDEITAVTQQVRDSNPEYDVVTRTVRSYVLNEWERYSVVFELDLTLKAKQ